MELYLKRKVFTKDYTAGQLFVEDKPVCFTIEDYCAAKPGEWQSKCKVFGKTAIPYGRYQVLVTFSSRFKRMLPGVFNVPDFEGIRIHNGSSELNTEGCVIVSYHKQADSDRLVSERIAMNDLTDMLTIAQKTQKIYLNIVEDAQ